MSDHSHLTSGGGTDGRHHLALEGLSQAFAEILPQQIWTSTPEGGLDYVNRRVLDYFDRSYEQMLGAGWREVIHPEDLPSCLERWNYSLTTGDPYEVEFRLLRAEDQTYRWHLGRAEPMRDSNGRVIRWFGTNTDIDDRKRAEEGLRLLAEAARVLSTTMEVDHGLKALGPLVVPRFADWYAVDLLEGEVLRRVEVVHRDPSKVALANELHQRYPPKPDDAMGPINVIRTGRSEMISDIPPELLVATARDPEHLRIAQGLAIRSYITVPLEGRSSILGAITFVSESARRFDERDLALAEDLARRAAVAMERARLFERERQAVERGDAAEAALRALNASLEQKVSERTAALVELNRELESFSYSVSHDLRAPVRHITGFAQLLERHAGAALDEKGLSYLHTIRDAALRAGQLVDDLLAFSRMGRAELHRSRVSLGPLLAEVRRELAAEMGEDRARWTVGPLPEVQGDPSMLRQVLKNLLSNALKFSAKRSEPEIQVTSHGDGQEVVVSVKDNGAGFDMKYVDKLFGIFQRLHPAEQFEGVGIGLANVRRIVQRHGGRTWAEGAPDRGATFFFSLPIGPGRKEG